MFDQKLSVCNRPESLSDGSCQNTGASSSIELSCNSEGLFRHPQDCSKFYRCEPSDQGQYTTYQFSCTGGLIFDEAIQGCNYPGI